MGFLHWLSECDTPPSIHSHKLPDSATLRIQNDSNPDPTYQDCWPSERYPSDGPDDRDQCSECRSAPGQPHAPGCDEAAKVTDSVINVASCPECGSVTDLDYGDGDSCSAGDSRLGNGDTFSIPFRVQEWMFESLCKAKLANLQSMIDDHFDLIIEMARDRFRRGYAKYGSAMYSWSPERRLDETLQELADAVVYPTSGPMP